MEFNMVGNDVFTSCGYFVERLEFANHFENWKFINNLSEFSVDDLKLCENWFELFSSKNSSDVADSTFEIFANLLPLLFFVSQRSYRVTNDAKIHNNFLLYYMWKNKQILKN